MPIKKHLTIKSSKPTQFKLISDEIKEAHLPNSYQISYTPHSQLKKKPRQKSSHALPCMFVWFRCFLTLRNELPLGNMHLPRGRHYTIHGHMKKPMSKYNMV